MKNLKFKIILISLAVFSGILVFTEGAQAIGTCGSAGDGVGTTHCDGTGPWTADSVSYEDTKYCVETCATSNGIVNLPAGSSEWNAYYGDITISSGKTLSGAGYDNTLITDITQYDSSTGDGTQAIGLYNGTLKNLRITSVSGVTENSMVIISGNGPARVTGCKFLNVQNGKRAIWVAGHPYAVIDNNIFQWTSNGQPIIVKDTRGTRWGDTAWSEPMAFGSSSQVYVEDNTFDLVKTDGIDCEVGCQMVVRYNTMRETCIGGHGCDSVPRASKSIEIYGNLVGQGDQAGWRFIGIQFRGGSGIVFDNSVSGTWSRPFAMTNYRSSNWPNTPTDYYPDNYPFCMGGTITCNGNASDEVDGNTPGMHGYPCRDQIGRGTNQALVPLYEWNNTYNGFHTSAAVYSTGISPDYTWEHIAENRDYYNGKSIAQTSPTSPFNGITGVGYGTIANRPTTCTPNVAYWATDEGEWNSNNPGADGRLYKCTSTNTWTLYYTPYTYPHPLRMESPSQTCPDGTPYGSCSSAKPLYCSSGTLINNCQTCGCLSGECQTDGSCQAAPQYLLPEQIVEAESGTLSGMQTGTSGPDTYTYTSTDNTGSASFTFNISSPGKYRLEARVNSNNDAGQNSFYVGLDEEPAQGNSYYTYDTAMVSAFTWDNVNRRGTGTAVSEFDPLTWDLTQGTHTFWFYGKESNTWLDQIILKACQRSDSNCDGCVSGTELSAFISLWYIDSSNPTLRELMEAIGLWKKGCP